MLYEYEERNDFKPEPGAFGHIGWLDCKSVWEWNGTVPPAIERCAHELIEERARALPAAPAICAWDGELTYGELDRLSTQLSHHLTQLGVGPEVAVPLCFEKSLWTVVAMLAVLKAGGAFVPLDPSQAAHRREQILTEIDAKIILTSAQYAAATAEPHSTIVSVDAGSIASLPVASASDVQPGRSPATAAYVLFTSGSTGQPKGVVVEHRSLSSSCLYHGETIEFCTASRVIQFAHTLSTHQSWKL